MSRSEADARGASRATRSKLADVARQADVSVSTVSKVLNGRAGVSERDPGPHRGAAAGPPLQPAQPRPRPVAPLLEVLCYEVDSPFASEVLASIEHVCAASGASGMVLTGADRARTCRPPGWVEDVLRRQPLGVMLVACMLPGRGRAAAALAEHPARAWSIRPGTPAPDVPSIGSADWNGGFLATRHLLDLGPPADRHHHRPARHDGLDRPAVRLPGGARRGRCPGRPRS